MWSPWKCEMITVSTWSALDAGGLEVGLELAGGAAAGVDHDRAWSPVFTTIGEYGTTI